MVLMEFDGNDGNDGIDGNDETIMIMINVLIQIAGSR